MIGLWVVRYKHGSSTPLTKAHLVESEIVERKVVRCGRELGRIDGTDLAVVDSPPDEDRCKVCAG